VNFLIIMALILEWMPVYCAQIKAFLIQFRGAERDMLAVIGVSGSGQGWPDYVVAAGMTGRRFPPGVTMIRPALLEVTQGGALPSVPLSAAIISRAKRIKA
jgi:hypothetical protein